MILLAINSYCLPFFKNIVVSGLDIIKQKLEDVLTKNQVSLKKAFQLSLPNISDELLQVGIITKSVQEEPTYDKIIRCFLVGIDFIDDQSEIEKECDRFLSALSNVGGPVARASHMLRKEWKKAIE